MIFFLREPATVTQPVEVILLVTTDDGVLVHSFDWNHGKRAYDQAVPLHVDDIESARTCLPVEAVPEPVPPEVGALECWVVR